jgi:type III restriction enzyme
MEDTGKGIDHLIINSPYDVPTKHWKYVREKRKFILEGGRRPAGYVVATEGSKSFDDPGVFIELPIVNKIRKRIDDWRENGYPGVTGITKRLLEHWRDAEERHEKKLFFCQMEAIETLIWLTEAPENEKQGIEITSDGGEFNRVCSKMATGSGKTVVMAMLIAWQVLNKVAYPKDDRFSKNILVIAPGLTVKKRLSVLIPSDEHNYYEEFNVIPPGFFDSLRQGKVVIHNWHFLMWDNEEAIKKKRSVVKIGPESDEAYSKRILDEMSNAKNVVVINDEAHHAWRIPAESKIKGITREEYEEGTVWVGGLDRIHRNRNILCCYDFSATPFAPSGKKTTEEALFGWIVSDFNLNDAIESGLVKTPRVVIRDDGVPDAKTYKSKLYHIYPNVSDDLNRKAQENEPLPDLILNAYYLLGKDWLETLKLWKKAGHKIPPVMITVCNRTETAARVEHAFNKGKIRIDELKNPEKTIRIDSSVLNEIEILEDEPIEDKMTKEERLRHIVDTVGKTGKPGEQIQNVIAVSMLSEGWDTKTVTHIMGLRAFRSQLLCEQVVGRGLRRTSYELNEKGLFDPEYVNIFGVPFTFLPHEGGDDVLPPPPPPKTLIEPDPEKKEYMLTWPNVIRIDHVYKPNLSIDWKKVKTLRINPLETPKYAEIAPVVEGKPDPTKTFGINLEEIEGRFRKQRIIFEIAKDVHETTEHEWKGDKEQLLSQLIRIVDEYLDSGKIQFINLSKEDDIQKRILIMLNMSKIRQHLFEAIRFENTEKREPVFDKERPIRSTKDMMSWYTSKPCECTKKSHISHVVCDSTWESSEAFELERNDKVLAWAKNDHLGFEILYLWQGIVRKYRPDFLIKLKNGKMMILEVKGMDSQQNKTKRAFLDEWIKAVNEYKGFGEWSWDVSRNPSDIKRILAKHCP